MAAERNDVVRAFFAIVLSSAMRAELQQCIEAMRSEPWAQCVRWVRSESLHLTLRFLGDVPRESLASLETRVTGEIAELPGFRLALDRVSLFPSQRRPRVVAAEVVAPEDLDALATALEWAVAAHGLPPEPRPFRGHITLGRIRGRLLTRPRLDVAFDGVEMWVGDVVLFRSVLQRSGAVYSELARIALRC